MERKSINRYRSFCSSLDNLTLAQSRNPDDVFVLSGTAQMFDLSFDLAWKVMKDILKEYHGIVDYPTGSPRETLRMAHGVGLIEDDMWMKMLKTRNALAHDYDGKLAMEAFGTITTEYYELMFEFMKMAKEYYE